jgi:ribosome-associated protein
MIDVAINSSPIELYKLLKFAGWVENGALGKRVIAEGMVIVNGNIELQKRKKIQIGDIIEFNGDTVRVVMDSDEPES